MTNAEKLKFALDLCGRYGLRGSIQNNGDFAPLIIDGVCIIFDIYECTPESIKILVELYHETKAKAKR